MMSKREVPEKVTSYDAAQLAESEQGWYFFDAAWKNWRVMFSNISGNSILDLGCGSGIGLSLAKVFRPHLSVTGVEMDSGYAKTWESRGINVVEDDIFNLSFPDQSFDTVWSSHVIEHLIEPKQMIAESIRVARHRVIHSVPVGNVDDKNMGTPHIEIYNRINFSKLFSDFDYKLSIFYVEDAYMSSFVAVVEK